MTDSQHVNVVHCMENFGQLHVCSFGGEHVINLRATCKTTPCDAIHSNLEQLLPQHVRSIIHQSCPDARVYLRKVPDGYLLITDQNQVICAIKDDHICQPANSENAVNHFGGSVITHTVVTPPGHSIEHFMFSEDDDGILPPHVISNFSPMNHIIAKMASTIPLTCQSRVIYHAANLGTLNGVNLMGPDAFFVKKTFLKLVSMMNGKQMYDVPIKMSEKMAKMLMLNDPEGNICCAPLTNGLMGYRNRKNNTGKTLIFICNCDDFFHAEPRPAAESKLQLFKMNYFNKKCKDQRIFVDTDCHEHGDYSGEGHMPTINIHNNNNNNNKYIM